VAEAAAEHAVIVLFGRAEMRGFSIELDAVRRVCA
jgi:hypothetical protein